MSVLVTIRVPGDTNQFKRYLEEEAEQMERIAENSRRGGCLRHKFGIGDGFVLVLDEWESAEQFQQFFSDPEIAEVMRNSGAQGEPEITVAEALDATAF
jgi:uncharacterized protein (DUF1330 family)